MDPIFERMGALSIILLALFVHMASCDEPGNVILLGRGRANEGAVLVRDSVRDEFKFLPAEGWTFKNSHVACRQVGFMDGFRRPFDCVKRFDKRNFHRRQVYDCEGSESTLEQCARKDYNNGYYIYSLAGVLCSDEGGTLSQFPILNGDNRVLRIAKNDDNPQWLILCIQKDSHSLAHLACQQTGRLFALRDGLDQPRGNILLAVENGQCTDEVIQACNITTHVVERATCSRYGLMPASCSYNFGYRLLGSLVNVCEEDLCQSSPHHSNDGNDGRRSCYCDSCCEFYGDCCFDYVTECIYGFNSSTVLNIVGYSKHTRCASNYSRDDIHPFEIEKRQLQCLDTVIMISDGILMGAIEIHQYLFAAKCHKGWPDKYNISRYCENEWIPGIPEEALVPVYDIRYNIHFKNRFCAECNNLCPDMFNGINTTCDRSLIPWSYEVFHLNNGSSQNFFYPPVKPNAPRRCMKAISSCPLNYTDEDLVEACTAYVSPVQYGFVMYRNEHCLKCNGHGYPVLSDRCNHAKKFTRLREPDVQFYTLVPYKQPMRPPDEPPVIANIIAVGNHVFSQYNISICLHGQHLSDFRCVPNDQIKLNEYQRIFNEYMVNCSTVHGILSFHWPSTILWHRHPLSCLYESDGSIPYVYKMILRDAFSREWWYTYQSESGFLTSIKAWSKWEMSSSYAIFGTMNDIKETLKRELSEFSTNCEVISASIGQECGFTTLNVSSNEDCHGTIIEGVSNASLSTWDNTTYIILPDSSAFYSINSLTYLSRFSDGEKSWSDSITACGQRENEGFTPLCNTILIPYSSYEFFNKNGMILVRYRGMTFEPNQYSLAENNSIVICEIPEFFTFTEAQTTVRRVFFTFNFIAMLLTFVTYSTFPTLRNLPGLCIMSVVMTLMVAYALIQYINDFVMEHDRLCKIAAILSHFSLLSAFVWMTILAWNLARTFALQSGLKRHQKETRKQYARLALFGFGLPALVVVPCIIIDLCECTTLPIWYGAGLSNCWINDPWGSLIVLQIPMLISLAFNCVLFVMTGLGIRKSRRVAKFATSPRTKATLEKKFTSLLTYIKVSSVMGFTWIVGYIAYFTGVRALWYVFIIFTFLQGFFIFVFFGLSAQSRKLWHQKFSCLRSARKKKSTISSSVETKSSRV